MAKVPFTTNPDKDIVRQEWDTPLLTHLHKKYKVRFRYCGLPGVDLLDVRLWKAMIDEIVAFEPLDKPIDGEAGDRRTAITALRTNMARYGIKGKAYCGSFEEVVVLRKDYEGTDYAQDHFVTLYNLDFCNELASKVETPDGSKLWRFEAIRQILRDQQQCFIQEKVPSWFMILITVRNQMDARKLTQFLRPGGLTADAKAYHDECSTLNSVGTSGFVFGTHAWAIKTLLFNSLCGYFTNPHLDSLFFPTVLYKGTKIRVPDEQGGTRLIGSPMLHAMIFCRFGDREIPVPEQWPKGFLKFSSVRVTAGSLRWSAETGETPRTGQPSCVDWLKQYGSQILRGL